MVALPEEALNEDELALARSEAWSDEEIAQLKEGKRGNFLDA